MGPLGAPKKKPRTAATRKKTVDTAMPTAPDMAAVYAIKQREREERERMNE